MSGRSGAYFVWVLPIIVAIILLGPPLACASKLPTACNPFHIKDLSKSGSCKDRIVYPDQKSIETEMAVEFVVPSEGFNGIFFKNPHTSPLPILLESNSKISPLRC